MLSGSSPQTEPVCVPQPHFKAREKLQPGSADAEPFPYLCPIGLCARKYRNTVRGVCRTESALLSVSKEMAGGDCRADTVIILNCRSISVLHHRSRASRMREMPSRLLQHPASRAACAVTPFKETRRGVEGLHCPTRRPPRAWAALPAPRPAAPSL